VRCSIIAVVLSVAIIVVPAATGAQQASNARVAHLAPSSQFGSRALPERAVPAAAHKSAVAAGVLSLWVPGMGSFYAGNTRHGWRHLGIHVASAGLVTAACHEGIDGCNGVGGIGALALLGNFVWASITAVRDANAQNAKLR